MKRFIKGQDRTQTTLLPECVDDYIGEDSCVRVVDVFVDQLDLRALVGGDNHSVRYNDNHPGRW